MFALLALHLVCLAVVTVWVQFAVDCPTNGEL
jgi:hypothetical protein